MNTFSFLMTWVDPMTQNVKNNNNNLERNNFQSKIVHQIIHHNQSLWHTEWHITVCNSVFFAQEVYILYTVDTN